MFWLSPRTAQAQYVFRLSESLSYFVSPPTEARAEIPTTVTVQVVDDQGAQYTAGDLSLTLMVMVAGVTLYYPTTANPGGTYSADFTISGMGGISVQLAIRFV